MEAKSPLRECGICWYVYDPGEGDPMWQVPPGTPFEELPEHWSCPRCAGEKTRFMPVKPGEGE